MRKEIQMGYVLIGIKVFVQILSCANIVMKRLKPVVMQISVTGLIADFGTTVMEGFLF